MPKKITLSLRCEYSDEELAEKRDEMSNVVLGAHEVEARKADAAKAFKEQLEALYSRLDVLARQVKNRGESRAVDCAVTLNKPTIGIKQIVRLDTGEFVKDELMTDDERQENLFVEADEIQKMYEQPDSRDVLPPKEDDQDTPPSNPEAA